MAFPDPAAHWKRSVDTAKTWRGALLERTLLVERAVDNILAHAFCSDEHARDAFRELILLSGALTLSSKTRILQNYLQAGQPDLWRQFGDTVHQIEHIREARNRIAHSQLELPTEPPQADMISLTKISGGKRSTFTFTQAQFEETLAMCTTAAQQLIMLQEALIDRVTRLGENPNNRAFLAEVLRVSGKPEYDHYLYQAIEIPGSLRRIRILTSHPGDEPSRTDAEPQQ